LRGTLQELLTLIQKREKFGRTKCGGNVIVPIKQLFLEFL
jgi:hypothetical protein